MTYVWLWDIHKRNVTIKRLKCVRCVKRGVNADHLFLLCKHRVVERPEKEPSLIAAENDEVDPPVEEETESSSS